MAAASLSTAAAQTVALDALSRDGYGVVKLLRPRPNVLVVPADVDGRKLHLLLDTAWTGKGIGVLNDPGSRSGGRAQIATLGNVQITDVPITGADAPHLQTAGARRTYGVNGILGTDLLRACSAIIDLQNLKLYLRAPGRGRRAVLGPAMRRAGLAEAPFAFVAARPLVDVTVNELRGRMVLATGAYHAAIDRRYAEKIGARMIVTRAGHRRPQTADEFERITRIDPRHREVESLVADAPMTPLRSFRISGVEVRAPDIRVRKLERDSPPTDTLGLLGVDILGANGALIDFGEKKLYFLPRSR